MLHPKHIKREGLKLFKEMEQNVENTIEENLKKLTEQLGVSVEAAEVQNQALKITTSPPAPLLVKERGEGGKKIGRNDPCPCGAINPSTGKVYKYKQCGLINAPHHKKS